jgi:hypothetical protein
MAEPVMDDNSHGLIEQLQAEVSHLRQENERLRAENAQLREQLDEARRLAARQAAPFRREERVKVPPEQRKPPGRKPGHPGSCRAVPTHLDETVEVPLDRCPVCGGPVHDRVRVEQVIEEIPPVRPRVVKVITYEGRCPRCGEVRSRHPLQTSVAQGAAKVQLGPRALAVAALLNKGHGLTMRKTCRVLQDLAGLRLTPGGLAQAMARVAGKVQQEYRQLMEEVRGSPAVFADETSWWVGGPGWWLWTFTTPEATVYRVEQCRGSRVVADMLGADFAGMLVSDCLSSYDPADYRKHKCIAHHLRAIAAAKKLPGNPDPSYLRQWELLLHSVLVLHKLRGQWPSGEFADKRQRVEAWVDQLLAQAVAQTGNARIQKRLAKQRPHLLGCLYEPAAEPTNNRAERALRPAVIARKLSCGNKTPAGRDCWQVLVSLAVTCQQRCQDFVQFLASRLHIAVTG